MKPTSVDQLMPWIREKLQRDPSWQVVALGRYWICPFCGCAAGDLEVKGTPLEHKVRTHLTQCTQWGGPNTPSLPLPTLSKQVILISIKEHITANQSWQQMSSDRVWYCPFCIQRTEVIFPPDLVIRQETLNRIADHLSRCYYYSNGQGKIRSVQEIQREIAYQNHRTLLSSKVTDLVKQDRRWQYKNPADQWICPYCRQAIPGINVASQILLTATAPVQIAEHLLKSCPGFQQGSGRMATIEELNQIIFQISQPQQPQMGYYPPPPVSYPSGSIGSGVYQVGNVGVGGTFTSSGSGVFQNPMIGSGVFQNPMTQPPVAFSPLPQPQPVATQPPAEEKEKINELSRKLEIAEGQNVEIRQSLQEAKKLQQQMLPQLPRIPGFDFGCIYRPCSELSGDFYDFIKVSDTQLGVVIGDVTGHGVEAALVMTMAKKLIAVSAKGNPSPINILLTVNKEIKEDIGENTFVSIILGILNLGTRIFKFVRAGHNPLVLFNSQRKPSIQIFKPQGVVVGMFPEARFIESTKELEIKLQVGDLLTLYTDGIVETMNTKHEEFGEERFHQLIKEYGIHGVQKFLQAVDISLRNFRGEEVQKDDISLVAIQVKS